jgi:ATP-binding cassette, subfamily B, bacterial HlyB/CyaB
VTLTINEEPTVDLLDEAGKTTGSLLDSLVIVARHRGVYLSREQLIRDHQLRSADVTIAQTLRIAGSAGLRARSVRLRWQDLFKLGTAVPAIVLLRNGAAMVLTRAVEPPVGPAMVVLQDPAGGEEAYLRVDEARLDAAWAGDVILIKRDYRLRDEDRPFGIAWVAGQLLRDRRITRDLTICAVLLGILAITPVLFWRVMVDRVMYYGSLSTFSMLCIAFAVLLVFETIFGHLRRYLVLFVTTRVDVKIWTHMFNKLLNLPIDFFERTPTGEIIHDMYEINRVRTFLTGQLFGTLLDSFVLVIFLPVMFAISAIMTGVILAICLLICVILVAMLPTVRRKVSAAVQAEVQRGTQLVEAVHGIRAVKSLALDARQRHEFDVRVARVAETRFDEGLSSNLIQTLVHPLQVLMTNGVIAVAVYLALVNKDPMYLGAIFAFMLMTQRVTMPVIQAAQSIVQIDEARRAIQRCAAVINQAPERLGQDNRHPAAAGLA